MVVLGRFVGLFIDFPKPLIAVVNGHAAGMPVTLLGLCDVVYASEKATFQTPFNLLGLTPEGCSTMTFPAIMGPAKATEVLLFSKALTAREACTLGLVTEVFPDGTFQSQVWKKLKSYGQHPKVSLALSKQLIRGAIKENLHTANSREYECITGRMYSGEFLNALQNYFQKRSKL
ncbi:enoyl-CoA delta isomerase 2-like [Ambystoma mexicanum]|uniref:enoyl-CoA delta isomerase 2-like n=1 Tax=Ambystoma mexicanum TaxID=8296 RepID=UPI0037E90EC4